jgi:hypothetical protein
VRAYTPGGRFSSDFEVDSIQDGIDQDLKNPVGTNALWWVYDPTTTTIDPIYDTGYMDYGKSWRGPYKLPIVRAIWGQGEIPQSERGFYSADKLHLTVNGRDLDKIDPNVLNNPDLESRGRIVWKGQVYRPSAIQQRAIVGERYMLVSIDCQQVMPDEMINDHQFLDYATAVPDTWEQPNGIYIPPNPVPSPVPFLLSSIDGGNP